VNPPSQPELLLMKIAMETMRELKTGGLIQQVTSIVLNSLTDDELNRNQDNVVFPSSRSTALRNGPSKASRKPSARKSNQNGISSLHASSLVVSERIGQDEGASTSLVLLYGTILT
jgi:hypothetical protein